MARRAYFLFWTVVFSCLVYQGCTGTPANFHSVALIPASSQTLGEGQTLAIRAQVANDSSNAGVTWSLTPASGSGTLGPTTTSNATYNAPANVVSVTTVTLKATSVTFPNESVTLTISVQPHPTITTTSLPSGSVSGAYSATVNASGGLGPFSWSVSSGTLPAGLNLGASTTNSVTISGTPLAQGSFSFTMQGDRFNRSFGHVAVVNNQSEQSRDYDHITIACWNRRNPIFASIRGKRWNLAFAVVGSRRIKSAFRVESEFLRTSFRDAHRFWNNYIQCDCNG